MVAQIIRGEPFKPGVIIVDFPPGASEDNLLHCHPLSDRIITVVKGSGEFIARKNGQVLGQGLGEGEFKSTRSPPLLTPLAIWPCLCDHFP